MCQLTRRNSSAVKSPEIEDGGNAIQVARPIADTSIRVGSECPQPQVCDTVRHALDVICVEMEVHVGATT